jgi:hypothetical protein
VRLSLIVGAMLWVLSATAWAQTDAPTPTRRLVTQTVDRNRTLILPGNTRPEANARNDRGPVADDFSMQHLQLLLRLPARKNSKNLINLLAISKTRSRLNIISG